MPAQLKKGAATPQDTTMSPSGSLVAQVTAGERKLMGSSPLALGVLRGCQESSATNATKNFFTTLSCFQTT
jgi:hypothetical protein